MAATDAPGPSTLESTWFIDADSPQVDEFVERALRSEPRGDDDRSRAVTLFDAVRDGIRYDPYDVTREPEAYRASAVATSTNNWCVPKSVLLTAAARRAGIPARLGFADVRNHLTSEKLSARMGTDVFHWHGYSELYLGDRWVKLSTAFNSELCERFGTKVLAFDGEHDALMHPFDESGRRHMEYVAQRGSFDDLPLQQIFDDFDRLYPDIADAADDVDGPDGGDEFRPA